jgi:hypothetical protein
MTMFAGALVSVRWIIGAPASDVAPAALNPIKEATALAGSAESIPTPTAATATSAILRLRVFNMCFLSENVAKERIPFTAGVVWEYS